MTQQTPTNTVDFLGNLTSNYEILIAIMVIVILQLMKIILPKIDVSFQIKNRVAFILALIITALPVLMATPNLTIDTFLKEYGKLFILTQGLYTTLKNVYRLFRQQEEDDLFV